MAFCTLLEWESAFPFDRYQQMNDRTQSHAGLPEGCLTRIVGRSDRDGATIIEVWRSGHDAQGFSEQNAHLLAEFAMPAPTRVAAFETSIFETG
jgi:hypothetical protein